MTCATITRKIGGKTYILCMDMSALHVAETLTGCNFLDGQAWESLNITCITALFFATACAADRNLKLSDIRALPPRLAPDLVIACKDAWQAANDVPAEDPRPTNGSEAQKSAASAQ